MFINKKRLLVYELANEISEKFIILPEGIEWTCATKDNIMHFFKDDLCRKKTFLKFISKGYYGIIMYCGNQWVSYNWMSKPDTLGPPHLPLIIQRETVYWLFYAHAHQNYRGRGIHKWGLQLRSAYALNKDNAARILTDTGEDNYASRQAKLSMGFVPKGIINMYKIKIPRIKSWTWGSWDIDAEHPVLDRRNNS